MNTSHKLAKGMSYAMGKLTGGASDWAKGMTIASQLPGRFNGPADTYRHLLISAELHRAYETDLANGYLENYERIIGGPGGESDEYVNRIGARIGWYVRSVNGSTADVLRLVDQVMENSFSARPWHDAGGIEVPGAGFKMPGARPTRLPNGAVLPPAVVTETDPNKWLPTNPVDRNRQLIPTKQTNRPVSTWRHRFNFANPDGVKAQRYMRRNRPAGLPDPVIPSDAMYP